MKLIKTAAMTATLIFVSAAIHANPTLTPGVWKNITPAGVDFTTTFGMAHIEFDPSSPSTLYAASDMKGLWKSTNAGESWIVLGDPNAPYNYENTCKYLDSPILLRIDPDNSRHMFCTQGVRGKTQGFWETTDGGNNWAMPAGFITAASTIGTRDMTQMAVDPTDFNHIIVGSHSSWTGHNNAGILETIDGGKTFIIHEPISAFSSGSMGINILYEPDLGIGNAQTWLVSTEGNGDWRTTNSGTTWAQVNTWGCPHGGVSTYYTKACVLYSGGYQYPKRSTDNGATWRQISNNLPYAYYFSVVGDGNLLYTARSGAAGFGTDYNVPISVSPESDGVNWTPYNPLGTGAQLFDNGPFTMHFDKVNRIMYSANWCAGLWALKVIDPAATDVKSGKQSSIKAGELSIKKCVFNATRTHVVVRTTTGRYCDLKGKSISRHDNIFSR